MNPTTALLDALATMLATDPATLAHATNPCKVHLAKNAFNSTPTTVLADLVEADFDGYAALAAGLGAQQMFVDPTSGQRVVQMQEPAGGWHWETTGTTALPQTIFGAYLTNTAGTVLYGTHRFPDGVTLNGNNEAVDWAQARFTFAIAALL